MAKKNCRTQSRRKNDVAGLCIALSVVMFIWYITGDEADWEASAAGAAGLWIGHLAMYANAVFALYFAYRLSRAERPIIIGGGNATLEIIKQAPDGHTNTLYCGTTAYAAGCEPDGGHRPATIIETEAELPGQQEIPMTRDQAKELAAKWEDLRGLADAAETACNYYDAEMCSLEARGIELELAEEGFHIAEFSSRASRGKEDLGDLGNDTQIKSLKELSDDEIEALADLALKEQSERSRAVYDYVQLLALRDCRAAISNLQD